MQFGDNILIKALLRECNVKAARWVGLCGERPLCQSNKTTIILVLGFKLFVLGLKINSDR